MTSGLPLTLPCWPWLVSDAPFLAFIGAEAWTICNKVTVAQQYISVWGAKIISLFLSTLSLTWEWALSWHRRSAKSKLFRFDLLWANKLRQVHCLTCICYSVLRRAVVQRLSSVQMWWAQGRGKCSPQRSDVGPTHSGMWRVRVGWYLRGALKEGVAGRMALADLRCCWFLYHTSPQPPIISYMLMNDFLFLFTKCSKVKADPK